MKTNQLANYLKLLAEILEMNPNIEISRNLKVPPDKKLEKSEVAVSSKLF